MIGITREQALALLDEWEANKKTLHLGGFNCQTAASVAYAVASSKIHGEFGRIANA